MLVDSVIVVLITDKSSWLNNKFTPWYWVVGKILQLDKSRAPGVEFIEYVPRKSSGPVTFRRTIR